jgi:hypothetical protein
MKIDPWPMHERRFYHGNICTEFGAFLGYDPAEMHKILKRECNPIVVGMGVDMETGELVDRTEPGTTRDMTPKERHDYFERCIRFAAEHGYVVIARER